MLTKLQGLPRVTSRASPKRSRCRDTGGLRDTPTCGLSAPRRRPAPGAAGPRPRGTALPSPAPAEQVPTSTEPHRLHRGTAMGGGAPPAPGRPPRAAAGAGRGPPRALRRCPAAPGQLPPAPPRGPRPAADKGRRGRYSPNKVRAMAPAGAGRAARGWHWRGGAHGTAAGRARGARRGEARPLGLGPPRGWGGGGRAEPRGPWRGRARPRCGCSLPARAQCGPPPRGAILRRSARLLPPARPAPPPPAGRLP